MVEGRTANYEVVGIRGVGRAYNCVKLGRAEEAAKPSTYGCEAPGGVGGCGRGVSPLPRKVRKPQGYR